MCVCVCVILQILFLLAFDVCCNKRQSQKPNIIIWILAKSAASCFWSHLPMRMELLGLLEILCERALE